MNFAKPAFLVFLTLVVLVALAMRSSRRRKLLLLAASYFFYGTWNIPFIGLILFSTSIDYWLSKAISTSQEVIRKRQLLRLGIVVNLTILAIFKYCNFFVDSINASLHALHLHGTILQHLNLLLPLGISFYTFEAISYLTDVYRGELPARSFADYNFYIMYFPHLISGPIVRYRELADQMRDGISFSLKSVRKGCELIILGLVYKLLIADTVSGIADPVFQNPYAANITSIYLAWAAFTAQIYFDFMGYTHIARGVSLLFNIELPLNFNHPYNAANISDFWQRWHISLSRWIRDYLYIPLGGSRGSSLRTSFNLLATMTIAGAWHGAGWAFIIWGAYHGLLLLSYHLLEPARKHWRNIASSNGFASNIYAWSSTIITFICAAYGWIWFRSADSRAALTMTSKLFRINGLAAEQSHAILQNGDYGAVATFCLLLAVSTGGPLAVRLYDSTFPRLPHWVKVQAATAAFVLCYICAGAESKPFIYFQF